MQLCLQRWCRPGLHSSSGLQRAQAIRMTRDFGTGKFSRRDEWERQFLLDPNRRFLAFGNDKRGGAM